MRLHADLTILARLATALLTASAVPLATWPDPTAAHRQPSLIEVDVAAAEG